ncbi:C39 family peptidase [Coriobacterium glomerans]|uniref:C39 family peptidase n=1 Tax=Coriobacterium glomerans TaxID=33871 RepID=UPI001FE06D84|nr:C39 family peptidase [Coriobacterium glomerans]
MRARQPHAHDGPRPLFHARSLAALTVFILLALSLGLGMLLYPSAERRCGRTDTGEQSKEDDRRSLEDDLMISTPRSQWRQGEMPHLYQGDIMWCDKPYAGGTIGKNGCGPTCVAMICIYLTGRTDLGPLEMCAVADAGGYAPTGATEWAFMTKGARAIGLSGTEMRPTRAGVTAALNSGHPLILSMGVGDFTTVGHFIVVESIDERGMLTIHDPNSSIRSTQRWGIVEVLRQADMAWSFSKLD